MKDLGTDEIQGYYYSRPLPPKDLEDFLKQNNHLLLILYIMH